MVSLDFLDESNKSRILGVWKSMSESDKAHFINQVALALSVWGSDERGKRMVVEVLRMMTTNGTNTLADFGLYVERITALKEANGLDDKIRRASIIIEGYRIKNALSSEPHREMDF
ncbi:MAG: hypothetical protein U0R44_06350 [Candidatus Micrarchaeia archaeon]